MTATGPGSGWRRSRLAVAISIAVASLAAAGWAQQQRPPRGQRQAPEPAELTRTVADDAGSSEAPLLMAIGVHIEPHGVSQSGGAAVSSSRAAQQGGRRAQRSPDYNVAAFFRRDVDNIRLLARLVESHGGKLVVQSQSPFTRMLVQEGDQLLTDLEAAGHEIGLHFHEDAQLGRGSGRLDAASWSAKMADEIALLRRAGAGTVGYWSGGNLYGALLEAARDAGLAVMSDYKNPRSQSSDESLLAVNPWRPAAGPREGDLEGFARHDPDGSIVYLPDGIFPDVEFGSMRRDRQAGGAGAFFDTLTEGLEMSLRAARPDRVNVFHITVHPGEYRGGPDGKFEIVEKWLSDVVDPLVGQGKVRWATFTQMAQAYAQWESDNPEVEARDERQTEGAGAASGADAPEAYVTFGVNVHDIRHVDESADTVVRLCELFARNGVRGDFYLTAPIVHLYADRRPDALAALRESGMTVSYHVRPPHPLYGGFDDRLRGLGGSRLRATLLEFETYRLDMATGELLREQPGGYAYVKDSMGTAPVVVGVPNANPAIRHAAMEVYRALGARVVVLAHEGGTDPERPFEWTDGLLQRPSDFGVTSWRRPTGRRENPWWVMQGGPYAAEFDPVARLASQVQAWDGPRSPFVTALIHENNFYRRGATPWALSYYADKDKRQPLEAPYDLEAEDLSRAVPPQVAREIWARYEAMVQYSVRNLAVVTSIDIDAMDKGAPRD